MGESSRPSDRAPYDVDLAPGGNERALARHHSRLLAPKDAVVHDRGYFSRALLAHHVDNGRHAVFRIRRRADMQLEAILASDIQDTLLTLKPRKVDPEPRTVRIVRAPRSDWVLLTTLLDARTCPAQGLADLYHQRWSIEELYKTIKQTLSMEAFHTQSLRGIEQELSAGLTLIALARLMTNDCERLINDHRHTRGGLL